MTLKNHFQRIRWAFTFSQIDLGAIEKRIWKNCKAQLYDFFTEDIRWTFGLKPKTLTNRDIVRLGICIGEATPPDDNDHVAGDCVTQVLALASKDRTAWLRSLRIEDGRDVQDGVRQFLEAVQTMAADYESFIEFGVHVPLVSEELSDLARLAAYRLLLYFIATKLEMRQIQRCPECTKIFLVTRRPKPGHLNHCSLGCAQKYASREYRKRRGEKLRAKERERSHRRYAAMQHRKFGPKVKVARRPRNGE